MVSHNACICFECFNLCLQDCSTHRGCPPSKNTYGHVSASRCAFKLLADHPFCSQDAIETHRNEKRQDGEARPVTLNEFVEELDAKDAFTAKLMEILVKVYNLNWSVNFDC
jgi:hypothetical protein